MSAKAILAGEVGAESQSNQNALLAALRRLAQRFLLVTIVLIGVVCGVLAVAFHELVELSRTVLIGPALSLHGMPRIVAVIAIPTIVAAILAVVIARFAPRAGGANLARVRRAYSQDPSLLGWRTIVATFFLTPLSLGSGAPLGPEGPTIVVASGVSVAIARVLQLPKRFVRGMIPVGVAAGIGAIFNAPITGVVFALEEVLGTAQRGVLGGAIVASVAAAVVERLLLGGRPLLEAPRTSWSDVRELIGFAIVGVVAGIVSGYSIAATHRLKRAWKRLMPAPIARAATGGVLIGLLGLVSPNILGVGYESVSFWLHGGGRTTGAAIAFAAKVVGFVVATSAGIIGGTFAPSLFIGAALGSTVGHGMHQFLPLRYAEPGAYALVGMGGFFAGLLRSPIAAVLIVVEVTRDYDLILPLMLAVSLAISISRKISPLSVVEQQMRDEGYFEEEISHGDPLSRVMVGSAMTRNVRVMKSSDVLIDAVRSVAGSHHQFYPVVDDAGTLVGIVTRRSIDAAAHAGALERTVNDVLEPAPVVALADEPVLDVVRRMGEKGVDRCPVVESESARRIVGFLSPADILHVRLRTSGEQEEASFEMFR